MTNEAEPDTSVTSVHHPSLASPSLSEEMRSHGDRTAVLAIAALTLLAAILRFSTLGIQSFWLDEAITIDTLRQSAGEILTEVGPGEINPPLYYVLAWVWTRPFGTGEAGLRSLSALLGTATVPLAYAAGASLVSRRAGLILAALVAVNPLLIWYSQEARPYPLLLFLGAASFVTFARALKAPRPRELALWSITSVLALATHYFAVFLVLVEAVWLLTRLRHRSVFAAVGAIALTGAALLPVAIQHVQETLDARTSSGYGEQPIPRHLADVARKFLVGESPWIGPFAYHAWLAALLALAGLFVAVWRGDLRERRGAAVAFAVGALAVAIPAATALAGFDVINTRNLIAMWLPFLLAVAAGFGATRARVLGPVLAAALLMIFLATSVKHVVDDRAQRDDWRRIAEVLGPFEPDRAVVVAPDWNQLPLMLYVPRLRTMPTAGRRIREIAVIEEHETRVSRPSVPLSATESEVVGRLRVLRFHLREEAHVRPTMLRRLVPRKAAILLG